MLAVDNMTTSGGHLSSHSSEMYANNTDNKNRYLSYMCPLLTLLITSIEREKQISIDDDFVCDNVVPTMNVTTELPLPLDLTKAVVHKRSKLQNGPIMLIICSSCKNAQQMYELSKAIIRNKDNVVKVLLLQGGGDEDMYDTKLANGCDLIICATPYCLLRMLGAGKTNLERLKYLCIDEANIVLERFPKQIKALIDHYSNLLNQRASQSIAQFILFANAWSKQIKKFIKLYCIDQVVLLKSKLEAAFFGNVSQYLYECDTKPEEKFDRVLRIIELVPVKTKGIIFINSQNDAFKLQEYLFGNNINSELIEENLYDNQIKSIIKAWSQVSDSAKRILILTQNMTNFVERNDANWVIHFDFPQIEQSVKLRHVFAERLWYMRDNYKVDLDEDNNNSNKQDDKYHDKDDIEQINLLDAGPTTTVVKEMFDKYPKSFILITENDKGLAESLLNYLTRIGIDEGRLPKLLFDMVEEQKQEKELKRNEYSLCPFIKAMANVK